MSFKIEPLRDVDLQIVDQVFASFSRPGIHKERFEKQKRGDATYLIAWVNNKPVAHIFVKWLGNEDAKNPHVDECVDVEALFVLENYRNQGIGTKLMLYAEELAREKGFQKIGLEVGLENTKAHALYMRLGYKDAGVAPFLIHDNYTDSKGNYHSWEETCIYLVKEVLP